MKICHKKNVVIPFDGYRQDLRRSLKLDFEKVKFPGGDSCGELPSKRGGRRHIFIEFWKKTNWSCKEFDPEANLFCPLLIVTRGWQTIKPQSAPLLALVTDSDVLIGLNIVITVTVVSAKIKLCPVVFKASFYSFIAFPHLPNFLKMVFLFSFITLLFKLCVCLWRCPWRPEEGVGYPWVGVEAWCTTGHVCREDQTQALCKISINS